MKMSYNDLKQSLKKLCIEYYSTDVSMFLNFYITPINKIQTPIQRLKLISMNVTEKTEDKQTTEISDNFHREYHQWNSNWIEGVPQTPVGADLVASALGFTIEMNLIALLPFSLIHFVHLYNVENSEKIMSLQSMRSSSLRRLQ